MQWLACHVVALTAEVLQAVVATHTCAHSHTEIHTEKEKKTRTHRSAAREKKKKEEEGGTDGNGAAETKKKRKCVRVSCLSAAVSMRGQFGAGVGGGARLRGGSVCVCGGECLRRPMRDRKEHEEIRKKNRKSAHPRSYQSTARLHRGGEKGTDAW